MKRRLKIVGGVSSTVGVGMLVGGLVIFWNTSRFIAGATEVEAKVIRLDRSGRTYHSVVEFTTATGKRIEFTSSLGSRYSSHRVADPVTVLYNPADPSSARIRSFLELWFPCLIVAFLGLILAASGFSLLRTRAILAELERPLESGTARL